MTSTSIDYKSTYFEHLTLTKIHGESDFFSLKRLKNQIKANFASVNTDLGGGRNGHLGLGLTVAEYVSVSQTAYIQPVYPGPVATVGATPHEIFRLRDYYKI